MQSALKKFGNSAGIVIPKPMLSEIGAQAGDRIDISVENGRIVLAPVRSAVREGWAEASRLLAEVGDDGLVWPEFPNDDDESWEW
ncbi:AbrB/MazE/SpoVT family DNA-binding domain-containing protein [Devosia sp. Root635]|uniref:AbrB/MazE/SpoVT family DNA-binding domain-containing protein n=1 Tax=Devosia sp. Root635 TaxID=1736575 RepID=UPI0006F2E8BB|nr:AbrB/MazE/SpoVT family DNA-binding domain-containing protein [Devosia sp. Root635]KRA42236.1 antitoxin [Devosia sp. Root635]